MLSPQTVINRGSSITGKGSTVREQRIEPAKRISITVAIFKSAIPKINNNQSKNGKLIKLGCKTFL